jgi:hypothetical protein
LNQHQRHGLCAKAKAEDHEGIHSPESPMSLASDDKGTGQPMTNPPTFPVPDPPQKPPAILGFEAQDFDDVALQMGDYLDSEQEKDTSDSEEEPKLEYIELARDLGLMPSNSDSDEIPGAEEADSGASDVDDGASGNNFGADDPMNQGPDTSIRDQF